MDKIEKLRQWALSRVGNPYLMGGTGQFCTPAYRRARMIQYPGSAERIKKNCPRTNGEGATSCRGCRYYDEASGTGKRAYDCAQFTRWAMDSIGIYLVSGATSQWNKTKWAQQGTIDTLPQGLLCQVFRQDDKATMGHTGLYLGDGTVAHAKGHDDGVVRQSLKENNNWTHWAIPEGMYEPNQVEAMQPDHLHAALTLMEQAISAIRQSLEEKQHAAR